MATAQDNYREACNKGFEAVSIQYGIAKKVDEFETYATHEAEKRVRRHVPEPVALVFTGAYTFAVAKEARISTGKVPYVQSTSLIIRQDSTNITFSWSF